MTMKKRITPILSRALSALATLAVTFALLTGTSSCDSAGTYWGVDQNYPIGNGNMYYGAYGGSGHGYGPHHGWNKKEYKKYKKYQKKREKEYRKQREKAYRKQMKKAHKHWRHHDDDDD